MLLGYLARNGLDAQMTDEPEKPGRPDDLFTPLPGDRGAHGRFDACAKERSWLGLALAMASAAGVLSALGLGVGITWKLAR